MSNPPTTHEQTDASFAAIVRFGIGLLITMVLLGIAVVFFQERLQRNSGLAERANRTGAPAITPPPPALQRSAQADLIAMRAATKTILHSYGWVDPKRGVIRLPIERAMALVAERGLPARAQGSAKTTPP